MGQIRVELMTPALSERCSNQLSYSPSLCSFDIGHITLSHAPQFSLTNSLNTKALVIEKEGRITKWNLVHA